MSETEDLEVPTDIKTDNEKKGTKRKKKRSANQMTKKLMRKRNRGASDRSCEVDTETYQYLIRIAEILRTDFSTMDDKLIFVENVYKQMEGREVEHARNQVGSRVIELLMDYASLEVIQRFFDVLGQSLRQMFSDKYASHILEKLIYVCADRGNKEKQITVKIEEEDGEKPVEKAKIASMGVEDKINGDKKVENGDKIEVTDDQLETYNNIALKLCKYAINNIEEFIYDNYANRVLRTAIECLGGMLNKPNDSSKKSNQMELNLAAPRREVIQDYTDLLKDTANRVLHWSRLPEFGQDNLTSGFLQVLLYSLKNVDSKMCNSIVKKITKDCFTENNGGGDGQLSNIFDSESSSRLLEACLSISSPKKFTKLYEKYFQGNVKKLSLTRSTNFTVQRLCDYCPTKETYETIFDEVADHFDAILEHQNTGVLLSLANACLRLQAKQGPFVNSMCAAVNCENVDRQSHIVPAISRLVKFDSLQSAKKQDRQIAIHLHGSLILQAILKFNKPIKIVNSLLAMDAGELTLLFNDPRGSRILDAFMESKFVGEKSRERMLKMMKGHWVQLATTVHGSRCLDKFWEYSKPNQRTYIMEELASVGQLLGSSKSGKLIYAKLNVGLFARDKKLWAESQNKAGKTEALFSSIIGK